jgi:hypothetical protein
MLRNSFASHHLPERDDPESVAGDGRVAAIHTVRIRQRLLERIAVAIPLILL